VYCDIDNDRPAAQTADSSGRGLIRDPPNSPTQLLTASGTDVEALGCHSVAISYRQIPANLKGCGFEVFEDKDGAEALEVIVGGSDD
jgi:hypothetical protein